MASCGCRSKSELILFYPHRSMIEKGMLHPSACALLDHSCCHGKFKFCHEKTHTQTSTEHTG